MCHEHNHDLSNNKNKKILIFAFSFTLGFALLEIIYGFISGSLMIIGDGIHMSSDAISLFLSLIAVLLASKLATSTRTFGYKRFEPIAAFVNGLTLILLPLYIIYEAITRFFNPVEINTSQMIIVGTIGLIINGVVGFILSRGESNLNMRSAMLHVVADMITSFSAVVVGVLILFTDLLWLDPIGSIVTSIIIIRGGIKITKEALGILMEGVPKHITYEEVKSIISEKTGEVADLKIWCTNESEVYVIVRISTVDTFVLMELKKTLHDKFDIHSENIYFEYIYIN